MSDNETPKSTDERSAWEGEAVAPETESSKTSGWEKDVLVKLATAALDEQRRARRWTIFFRALTFIIIFWLLFLYQSARWQETPIVDGKHTALIEIVGVIADDADASADNVIAGLREAFDSSGTAGVILRINSPGGSPVQAGYINDEIRRLRAAHPKVPVYAVVTDICASGGYYIAAAADKIYADKASIVGSIGVRMSGLETFGFVDAMRKLGIERRLLTAGENKGALDPFSPMKPEEVAHIKSLLGNIHQQFIDTVKKGRGNRLKNDPELFSGLFWTGEQGKELGLVDDFGSASYVAREIIGAERIEDFTHQPDPFDRIIDRLGVAMAKTLVSTAQTGAEHAVELR